MYCPLQCGINHCRAGQLGLAHSNKEIMPPPMDLHAKAARAVSDSYSPAIEERRCDPQKIKAFCEDHLRQSGFVGLYFVQDMKQECGPELSGPVVKSTFWCVIFLKLGALDPRGGVALQRALHFSQSPLSRGVTPSAPHRPSSASQRLPQCGVLMWGF